MKTAMILALSALSLAGLLTAKGMAASLGLVVLLKALCSLLFLALVLVRAKPDKGYFAFIFGGLLLGLVGDVALEFEGATAFLIGLSSFLAGHLAYVLAFARIRSARYWFSLKIIPLWLVAGLAFVWLFPHAAKPEGSMVGPVAFYIVVISLMVSGAAALSASPNLSRAFKTLVLAGAILFFLSDLLVAVNAFISNKFLHSLILLPLYYTAQLMLAASVAEKKK